MARKTIQVKNVVEKANHILSQPDSEYVNKEVRQGVIGMVHWILDETDNYGGFVYQSSEFVDSPDSPGGRKLREDYDSTRRFYYYAGNL